MSSEQNIFCFSASYKINIIMIISMFCLTNVCLKESNNEETSNKDYVTTLISRCGYPTEVHRNIQTEDGYLLTMQRIPVIDKEYPTKQDKIPVLLMHGLLASAEHFVLLNCSDSLAFMLANEGYDVWLGNVRTVSYSRHHVHLDPDEADFWDINMDHFGSYDVPAFIDYILKTTGHQQIMYVGHSQGNMIFYIMCDTKPEYASKVRLFVQLSPVASMKNMPHPWVGSVCKQIQFIQRLTNTFGIYELTLGRDFVREYGITMCGMMNGVCKYIIYLFSGLLPSQFPDDQLNRLLLNCPEGIASQQFIHACLMLQDGVFEKFNYGSPEENMIRYGSEMPPEYDLSLMTTPTAVYYSANDWFLDVNEARDVVKRTPNVVDVLEIPLKNFSHFDFILGNLTSQLNARIIREMNKCRSNLCLDN